MRNDQESPAILNRIRENLLTLEYQTKIKVEGVGDYEIKMQNVIDTRTFRERPIIPTLLSFANT